jgi:hypothetical protein
MMASFVEKMQWGRLVPTQGTDGLHKAGQIAMYGWRVTREKLLAANLIQWLRGQLASPGNVPAGNHRTSTVCLGRLSNEP